MRSDAETKRLLLIAEVAQGAVCCRLCRDVHTGDHPTTAGRDLILAAINESLAPVEAERDRLRAGLEAMSSEVPPWAAALREADTLRTLVQEARELLESLGNGSYLDWRDHRDAWLARVGGEEG